MKRLSAVKTGAKLRFVSADGGKNVHHRLAEMGLVPGEKIKIVHNAGQGQVIVEIKGSRVAFGYGLAQKIVVREAKK